MIERKGVLWGMCVREETPGTGLAQAMVETVLESAKAHAEQVALSVITASGRGVSTKNGVREPWPGETGLADRRSLSGRRVPGPLLEVTLRSSASHRARG